MQKLIVLAGIAGIGMLCIFQPAYAQEANLLHGPVTALHVTGDRLLIGQQSVLLEAQISSMGLRTIRQIPLGRHTIRAITTTATRILVLSEDGVTLLNQDGAILDFVPGGGQRIFTRGDRVYVAALQAGIRIMRLDPAGKLVPLATLKTGGAVFDLIPESPTLLRSAEGERGIRLYELQDVTVSKLLGIISTPATVMTRSGDRLIAGSGRKITLFVGSPVDATPRLVSSYTLTGTVSDLAVRDNQVFVGRIGDREPDESGPDVLVFDITDSANLLFLAVRGQYGESGRGEHITFYGDDLFVGSTTRGLRWLHFEAGVLKQIILWELDPAANQLPFPARTTLPRQGQPVPDGWLATPAVASSQRISDPRASDSTTGSASNYLVPALIEIGILALVILVSVINAARPSARKPPPHRPKSPP